MSPLPNLASVATRLAGAAAAAGLRLNAIKPVKVGAGGYQITHTGHVPAGGKLYVCLTDADNRLDITHGISTANLPNFLALVEGANGWGTTLRAWAVLEVNGKFVSETPAQDFDAPVKPFGGTFTFAGFESEIPKLTYPGNGHGRLLTTIGGKYYFVNGGMLETDNAKRGFDCTTFPMALFQKTINMTGKYGTALADALGATKCEMEQKKKADVKAFFADTTKGGTGLYFMWSAGHVVLVKNATIHEFTYGGYKKSPAASWGGYDRAAQGLWWIRKLPASLNP